LTTTLADNLRFFRALITRPKDIGALAPSSAGLAKAIADQIDPKAGPVLEVGPGTGVISQAILARGVPPEQLTLLEYDQDLAGHLAAHYPRLHVIHGDAFNLDSILGPGHDACFGAIVSGIPLLNHPVARRHAYVEGLTRRLMPGSPLIQFSYGANAPVVPPQGYLVTRAAVIWANLPPARVWVYRKG
jgi:phosphatidylethanolamine/phosphatidyl-N-methylethanolamine N-methyltransferase